MGGAEGAGRGCVVGAELHAGGAVQRAVEGPAAESVDEFAARVGRGEHDDAAE